MSPRQRILLLLAGAFTLFVFGICAATAPMAFAFLCWGGALGCGTYACIIFLRDAFNPDR